MQYSMSLFSTLGKKVFMSISGLMLSGFIIVHLLGNLTLLSSDRDPFNKYANFLTQGVGNAIYVAEFMLASVFLIHFFYAIFVTVQNWRARPVSYAKVTGAKGTSRKSFASVSMIYTGAVIIIFTIMHLFHFKFGEIIMYSTAEGMYIRDLYTVVYKFFGNIWNTLFYIVVMVLLGFHLSHGVWSAFQSIGLNGKRFTPFVYGIGSVFALVMAVGFIVLPAYIFFLTGGAQ